MLYKLSFNNSRYLINIKNITHVEQYNNNLRFYLKTHSGFGSCIFGSFNQKDIEFKYDNYEDAKYELENIAKFSQKKE
jgi:hypothetical protein